MKIVFHTDLEEHVRQLQSLTVGINKRTSADDILQFVCNKLQLNPRDHYVRVKLPGASDGKYVYPNGVENLKKMKSESVEVCQRYTYQVELCKDDANPYFGLKIEAELAENYDRDDYLLIFISEVKTGSLAHTQGLMSKDEILMINGKVVSELDMVFVESLLTELTSVCLTVRSLNMPSGSVTIDPPVTCPPPPSQSRIKIPPPSSVLPEEILKQDKRSIELYKQALADGEEKNHDIRVMIIGHWGVGKTAIRKRMLNQPFDVSEVEPSTDGIDVFTRQCRVSLEDGRWIPLENEDNTNNFFVRLANLLKKPSEHQSAVDTEIEHVFGPISDIESDSEQQDDTELKAQDEQSKVTEMNKLTDRSPSHIEGAEIIYSRTHAGEPESINKTINVDDIKPDVTMEDENTTNLFEDLKEVITAANQSTGNNNHGLVSIWDFAGQSVFYSTHQVFLSKRAVYLLVTNMENHVDDIVQDDDGYFNSFGPNTCVVSEFVEFWLNSIHSYCGSVDPEKPNVILVGTHADKLDETNKDKLTKQYFRGIRNLFMSKGSKANHVVEEEFALNNKVEDDPALDELKQMILEVAKTQPYWGESVPARWITLEKTLAGLRESNLKIMTREEIAQINGKLPVPLSSEEELESFLRFQHDIGTIIYFSERALRENILLDPQWVINAMRSIISFDNKKPSIEDKWRTFRSQGILKHDLLKVVWRSKENSLFWTHREHLLGLMERLDLIARPVRLDAEDTDPKMNEDEYFVPSVLNNPPPKKLTAHSNFPTTSHLCFTTNERFIPIAVFNRLLVACLKQWPPIKQKPCIYCRFGTFELSKSHRLMIYLTRDFIQIWITNINQSRAKPDCTVGCHVRAFIGERLNSILDDSGHFGEIEIYVKCPKADLDDVDKVFDLQSLRDDKEISCEDHDETHSVQSDEMLQSWFQETEDGEGIDAGAVNNFKTKTDSTLDQKTVELFPGCMKSVGAMMYSDNVVGTAFRVGSKYVMTAAHVVTNIRDRQPPGRDPLDNVFINFNGDPFCRDGPICCVKSPQTFTCRYLDDLDVAVLEVSNPVDLPVSCCLLDPRPVGDYMLGHAAFVGYGHPNKREKHLEPRGQIIPQCTDQITQALFHVENSKNKYREALKREKQNHKLVEKPYQDINDPDKMCFSIFMEQGASGAPALCIIDNAVYVVAVITHGLPRFLWNISEADRSNFPVENRFEMGARMSCIYERMKANDPPLAKDLFGQWF